MPLYGILKSVTNTGSDSELSGVFSTPLSVTSKTSSTSADTLSLRRVVSSTTAQRWEIEAEMVPSNTSPNMAISLIGKSTNTPVFVRMPQPSRMDDVVSTGTITLSAAAAVNDTDIAFTGGTLVAGEFIQIGSPLTVSADQKVYFIEAVTGSVATVTPRLRGGNSIGAPVTIGAAVTMIGYYDDSASSAMRYSDGMLLAPGTVRIIEKLR